MKAENDWRGVGRHQVAMHRICQIFQLGRSTMVETWEVLCFTRELYFVIHTRTYQTADRRPVKSI